ncbi:MAG: imidazole glycerol phosphate synthase subunit HisH [Syntrophaceae bacterium]|nr:imidazole glycerol phosphate synthase subunit HisH [Syntrophaceae bacterium]
MIAVVDYGAGNLTSVARALEYIGKSCRVTDDPEILETASHVIFPGVGAAGDAMQNLRDRGLDQWIKQWFASGKPLLGICLGTQVIFDYSEENETPCLGLIPGRVKRFPPDMRHDGQALKIPHMGWNGVSFTRTHPVFTDVPAAAEFYFVHTYYPAPDAANHVVGRTEYGISFCSAVAVGNLVAVQFHPEKSGVPGLKILENFCTWEGIDAE